LNLLSWSKKNAVICSTLTWRRAAMVWVNKQYLLVNNIWSVIFPCVCVKTCSYKYFG
jgi:hypothetical protein